MSLKITADDKRLLKRLGKNMRELRQSKKWTLEGTEDHGWIEWRSLQRIENGQTNVTLITLRRLARLYRVPLEKILTDLD